MSEDTTNQRRFDEADLGASVHDTGGRGEIGTIEDYDVDHVYVHPNEEFDDDETLNALGWRTPDGSSPIDTDAIQGLPDDVEGHHGVDLSAYEDPDEDVDATSE